MSSTPPIGRPSIPELWFSTDARLWDQALEGYWTLVKPQNLALERELDTLALDDLRSLDAAGWYAFLHDKYFPWKYTAPNRLTTTRKNLRLYVEKNALDALNQIRLRLLALDLTDLGAALATATEIRGLGTAGASGLLALMYPHAFATVDQFVVRALREVKDPLITSALSDMNPEGLTLKDGVVLTGILRRKAEENNLVFSEYDWTPRKIEMILWTYGASSDPSRPRGARQRKRAC
jgi:hypothetical protein